MPTRPRADLDRRGIVPRREAWDHHPMAVAPVAATHTPEFQPPLTSAECRMGNLRRGDVRESNPHPPVRKTGALSVELTSF